VNLYNSFLIGWTLIAVITFLVLFFKTAPYGRHIEKGWGLSIPSRIGWIIMESPALLLLILFFFLSANPNFIQLILLGFWCLHYFHRSFIWPFRAKISNKSMPISIAFLAIIFNLINGSIQGLWIFNYSSYSSNWITSTEFILGSIIFIFGMLLNIHSDNVLLNLRRGEEKDYRIPQGFFFNRVSCPNYLGEIIEWLGWAIMTWSFAGLIFFIWTAANLIPRAYANHKWYKNQFTNYPSDRKAIIPYLF
tara:strand:- start:12483 stop:13229 length:747 start_codon:yes stop_codon:yes gene_type:complete